MSESEDLWTKENLIDQLEEMQLEIESKDQQISYLRQTINKLQVHLAQKEGQIQNLLSEISKLQSELQKLSKELQIKSEKLVKQSKADLILIENEKLKEIDKQREQELKETKKNCSEEILSAKQKYENLNHELNCQKEDYKSLNRELDKKIEEQDILIDQTALDFFEMYRSSLDRKFKKRTLISDVKYKTMITAIHSELWSSLIYALIVTVFIAVRSESFTRNVVSFLSGIKHVIAFLITNALSVGTWCAMITNRIDIYAFQQILYYLIIMIIPALICGIPGVFIYLTSKKYIEWYKEEIADHISLWVTVMILAITIFFSKEITSILSINLIWLNIIIHLIYSAGRAYIRECRKERGII